MKDLTVKNQFKSCEGVALPNLMRWTQSISLRFQHRALERVAPSTRSVGIPRRDANGKFRRASDGKKSPPGRGGLTSRFFGMLRRGGFLAVIILLALFLESTFAQQSDAIPLTPFKGGQKRSVVEPSDTNSSNQLQKYLQIAAERNPSLEADFYRYLAALQKGPQVGSLPDPEVMFGYFISPIETRLGPQTARVSVSQMFPWFGTLDAREDAAVLQAKAQFASFQDHRNRLFYRVKEKWSSLYIINKKISILDENIEIMETLLDITLQEYQTGTGNQADVLQAQIELEDLRVQKQQLIDDKHVLIREFNELLNTTGTDTTLGIPSSLKPVELSIGKEQLMQLVLENNPKLNRLYFREQSAEASLTAARLSGYPSFGIGAGYMFIEERPMTLPNNGKNAFVANLTVQIPLFRDKYKAKKRQAALQKNVIEYEQIAAKDNLITAVESALRDYREAKRNYELYSEIQIQRSRQALDILQQQYATGEADFEELLRLQRKILQYRLAKQKALGNMYIAKARIEYLYGKYNVEP